MLDGNVPPITQESFDNYNSREELLSRLKRELGNPFDLIDHVFTYSPGIEGHCLFIETVTDKEKIEKHIIGFIEKVQVARGSAVDEDSIHNVFSSIPVIPLTSTSDFDKCIQELLNGKCLVMYPGLEHVLLLDVQRTEGRSIDEPSNETTIRGPREGFTESIAMNLTLIRKRIKDVHLRMEQSVIGEHTHTTVITIYMENLADEEVLTEFRKRLDSIKIDSVIDSSYIEEFIQEKEYSPFPTLLNTERPDVVVSHLLEGRIALLSDGSPFALIAPISLYQLFSAPEDYYQKADIATIIRWIRMLSALLTIFVPALYISVVSYHPGLLPAPLLVSIAAQREGVPFPTAIEAFLMMIVFEVLREAGLRMPRVIGQAISIVGALVIGQAAVQAGIFSAAMVIVVSITAIANFAAPNYTYGITQRLLMFLYMLLGAFLGIYGVSCGVLLTVVHLASLKSFGVPYLSPLAPTFLTDWKDTFIRVSRAKMNAYPEMSRTKTKQRRNSK
jgi:hypothetical protein